LSLISTRQSLVRKRKQRSSPRLFKTFVKRPMSHVRSAGRSTTRSRRDVDVHAAEIPDGASAHDGRRSRRRRTRHACLLARMVALLVGPRTALLDAAEAMRAVLLLRVPRSRARVAPAGGGETRGVDSDATDADLLDEDELLNDLTHCLDERSAAAALRRSRSRKSSGLRDPAVVAERAENASGPDREWDAAGYHTFSLPRATLHGVHGRNEILSRNHVHPSDLEYEHFLARRKRPRLSMSTPLQVAKQPDKRAFDWMGGSTVELSDGSEEDGTASSDKSADERLDLSNIESSVEGTPGTDASQLSSEDRDSNECMVESKSVAREFRQSSFAVARKRERLPTGRRKDIPPMPEQSTEVAAAPSGRPAETLSLAYATADPPRPSQTGGQPKFRASSVWGDEKSRLAALSPIELAAARSAFVHSEAAAGRSLSLNLPEWAAFVPVKVDVEDIQKKIALMKRSRER
jgi:hypothetical protein